MTTPARQEEADRVELAYHFALTQLGVQTIEEAIELWQEVPATEAAATAAGWLSRAIELIMTRRVRARAIGLAYYRLVRALRTGSTIGNPSTPEPKYVSLETLRLEFEALVDEVVPPDPESPSEPLTDTSEGEGPTAAQQALDGAAEALEQAPEVEEDDDDRILLEEIEELDALIEQEDREAEEQAALLMDQLGIENLLDKLSNIDTTQSAEDADKQREEAHRQAGARQAAVAERITNNAARGLTYDLAEYDGRVLGWARFSTTGTPCGWCAMLISRGAVYRSKTSASIAENDDGNRVNDQDKYHDNCHCIAIPLFTDEQYDGSSLFRLNREYKELWPIVTKGLGGDAALSAWRYFIRQQQREAAQAAAS